MRTTVRLLGSIRRALACRSATRYLAPVALRHCSATASLGLAGALPGSVARSGSGASAAGGVAGCGAGVSVARLDGAGRGRRRAPGAWERGASGGDAAPSCCLGQALPGSIGCSGAAAAPRSAESKAAGWRRRARSSRDRSRLRRSRRGSSSVCPQHHTPARETAIATARMACARLHAGALTPRSAGGSERSCLSPARW